MSANRLEGLYLQLPIWLQQAAVSANGWLVERRRYSPPFDQILTEYEERDQWEPPRLAAWRDRRLREFLTAASILPFYRQWFGDHGVRVQDVRGLDDLHVLPVLTKAIVRDAQDRGTLTPTGATGPVRVAHTSGTTGSGLRFPVTEAAVREQWAVWWRYRGWHGIRRGTWCAYFGGRSLVPLSQRTGPFWRANYSSKQLMFSAYHLTAETAADYVAELRRHKHPWIHGYPSVLALLASYLLENGETLDYPVRWVTLGAENVLPLQSQLIRKAFGISARQHYGMAEGVANASECPAGRMHVDEDYAAVEFLPLQDNAAAVVGTNFTNLATPLIRYEVGDVAALSNDRCSCGRGGRVVTMIDGRQEDYVVLPDGARVGRLDHVFKDMEHVREAQIVQRRMDSLLVRIVRGPGFQSVDEAHLRQEFLCRLGHEIAIEFTYVDHLPRTSNGKVRFVISELAEGRITAPSFGARRPH